MIETEQQYAFCEPDTAGSLSKWHIRKLTDKGLKLSGGADTPSLCGREMSWDINVKVQVGPNGYVACHKCTSIYLGTKG